jgi:uncharacterized protein affecting Mg2+/Co2+ transport
MIHKAIVSRPFWNLLSCVIKSPRAIFAGLLLVFTTPVAIAQTYGAINFQGVTISATSGNAAANGKMMSTISVAAKVAFSGDAVSSIEIMENGMTLASASCSVTYNTNDIPVNSVCNLFGTPIPFSVGIHNVSVRAHTDQGRSADTPTYAIIVNPYGAVNNAQVISQSVPSTMIGGDTSAASITVKNTGGTTWALNGAGVVLLSSQNPAKNSIWGTSGVGLPVMVAPGEQYSFKFNITAPATAGTYNFQWQMRTNSASFGDLSPNVGVYVTPPGAPTAAFASPADDTVFPAGVLWGYASAVASPGFTISKLELLDNGQVLNTLPIAQNTNVVATSFNLLATVGVRQLQLRATDNLGVIGLSQTRNITVLKSTAATCPADEQFNGVYTASTINASLWGNNSSGYSTDSSIPAALVHSGLLA